MLGWLGHASSPETELASAFLLIRPSLRNDPWGRDVIEAVCAGVPVIATGSYEGVIENGKNGFLFDEFDVPAIAQRITDLYENERLWQEFRRFSLNKADVKFRGLNQKNIFTDKLCLMARKTANRF